MNKIALSPFAIITEEKCAQFLDHDTDENGSLIKYINYASKAIATHCGRNLARAQTIHILDSYGDRTIRLPAKPVIQINSLRYDRNRVFDDDTELEDADHNPLYTFSAELGIINLPKDYVRDFSVFRVVMTSGYDRVAFMQNDEPSGAVDGEVWMRTDGTMRRLVTGQWQEFFGFPMPEDLEGACAEYVSYLKIRFRTGGSGLIMKRRAGNNDGSDVSYEYTMPVHVKERIEAYASRAL